MNILLVAEESAGVQTLKLLTRTEHTLVAVLTTPPARNQISRVGGAAGMQGIPVLPADLVRDPEFATWIRTRKIDVLLNTHSLHVIHPGVVDALRFGAFNLHPGPLPEYAGLNAPSWAIYRQESRHAVTLHWIADGIDTGAVAWQNDFDLDGTETGLTLSARCVKLGIPMIRRLMDELQNSPPVIPKRWQDHRKRNYFGRKEVPGDGKLHWSGPARQVEAFVRASDYSPFSSPWGMPWTTLPCGGRLFIPKTTLSGRICTLPPGTAGRLEDGTTAVATADEWLVIDRCLTSENDTDPGSLLPPGRRLT